MSRISFSEKYPKEVLRALSWKQPFASLMLHGKIETRVWDSKYFGWVLICASKKQYTLQEISAISGIKTERALRTIGAKTMRGRGRDIYYIENDLMPLGYAIAIGKLARSYKMDKGMSPYSTNAFAKNELENKCFVSYNPDLWCHEYEEVQSIVPFAWHGTQGWSTVSDEVKSKIILL